MTSRNLALFLALAGALVGCGGSDGGGGGGGGGGGDGGGGGGDTYFYVVSSATLGAIADGSAPGFNLDGSDVNVCGDETTVVDYTSQAPESGNGVDNQLIVLADSLKDVDFGDFTLDLDTLLKEAVLEGKFTLLLEVSGVDDLDSDDDVKVSAYLGDLVGGGTPASSGGKLTADQDFEVATTIKANAAGEIVDGRLSISLDALDVTVPVESKNTEISLTVNDVRLKFDISATQLTNGVLGGSLNVDATLAEIKSFLTAAEIDVDADTLVEPVLTSRADLNQNGEDCEDVSAAIVFTGAAANKN